MVETSPPIADDVLALVAAMRLAWPRLISSWQRGLTGQWARNLTFPNAKVNVILHFVYYCTELDIPWLVFVGTAAGYNSGTGTWGT